MKQFTFTSFDDPETRRGGWQIKDSSGLSFEELVVEEELLSVGARLVSHIDAPAIVRAHERENLPTRLALTAAGGATVRLSQERPAGTDGSGRPDNTFTHTVIAPWHEIAALVELPIRTLNSEAWLSPYGAKEVADSALAEVDFFPEFLEYDWADVLTSHLETFAAVLDTLDATIQQRRRDPGMPRPLVVLRTDDMHRGVQWLEAVMSACLPVDAWNLHFSTYERNVDAHRAGQLSSAGYDIVISRDHDVPWSPQTLVVELDTENAKITHGQSASGEPMSWGRAVVALLADEIHSVGVVSQLSELENLQADYQPAPSSRMGWGAHLLQIEQRQRAGQEVGSLSTAMLAEVVQEIPPGTRMAAILVPVIPKAFNDPETHVTTLLRLVQNTIEEHTKVSLLNGLVLRVLNDEHELEQLYPYEGIPTNVSISRIDLVSILEQQRNIPSPFYALNALLLLQQLMKLQHADIAILAQLWCGSLSPEAVTRHETQLVKRLQRLHALAPSVVATFAEVVAEEFEGPEDLARALSWRILHTLRAAKPLAGIADQLLLEGAWGQNSEATALAKRLLHQPQVIHEAAQNYVTYGYLSSKSLEKILRGVGRNFSVRSVLSTSAPHIRSLVKKFLATERSEQWGSNSIDELSRYYLTDARTRSLELVYEYMINVVNFASDSADLAGRREFIKHFETLSGIRVPKPIAEGRCGEAVGQVWLIITDFMIAGLAQDQQAMLPSALRRRSQTDKLTKAEMSILETVWTLQPKTQESAWQHFLPGMVQAFETAPNLAAYLWVQLQLADDPRKHLKGDALQVFLQEERLSTQYESKLSQVEKLALAVLDRTAGKRWDKTARRELESTAKAIHKANEKRLKAKAFESLQHPKGAR